jgi:hypothetical protein
MSGQEIRSGSIQFEKTLRDFPSGSPWHVKNGTKLHLTSWFDPVWAALTVGRLLFDALRSCVLRGDNETVLSSGADSDQLCRILGDEEDDQAEQEYRDDEYEEAEYQEVDSYAYEASTRLQSRPLTTS